MIEQADPAFCHASEAVRVATYNIRRCLGTDGRILPERTADVIASLEADVIALQEVDVNRMRSGRVDQAEMIAAKLGMGFQFHPAMRVADELYGIAVLCRLPMRVVKAGGLPQIIRRWSRETRGALWVELSVRGTPLQVFTTHFGLFGQERLLQAEALVGPEWIGHRAAGKPQVLMGDFNSRPRTASYRTLAGRLTDCHAGAGRAGASFPSRLPMLRIDHVFVSDDIQVGTTAVARSALASVASDHLPVVADLQISVRVDRSLAVGEGA